MSETTNEISHVNSELAPPVFNLRWFAGLAMQAIIQKQPAVPNSQGEREEIALWAYRMAEEMVATEQRLHLEENQKDVRS